MTVGDLERALARIEDKTLPVYVYDEEGKYARGVVDPAVEPVLPLAKTNGGRCVDFHQEYVQVGPDYLSKWRPSRVPKRAIRAVLL